MEGEDSKFLAHPTEEATNRITRPTLSVLRQTNHKFVNMFARRAGLLRAQQPFRLNLCRPFSTAELDSGVKIAYDFFEPAKEATSKDAPIVFIHGLFGSKRNNGSMSKYAVCALQCDHDAYILTESLPAS